MPIDYNPFNKIEENTSLKMNRLMTYQYGTALL